MLPDATISAAVPPAEPGRDPDSLSVGRPVLRFALAGLVAVVLVAFAGGFALSRLGTEEAIADAKTVARVLARGVVEPALTDALASGDPAAVASLDRTFRERVLIDPVVRIKLWTTGGRIVYSDAKELIGATFDLRPDELAALQSGVVAASLSDLSEEESQFERGHGDLLEVYLPVRAPGGEALLMELYLRYDSVVSDGRRIFETFLPVIVGALILLAVLQLPLAVRLSRELRARTREREALLQRTIDAGDVERRRIAADLHDGIVQEMAALSFQLATEAGRTGQADGGSASPALVSAAEAIRRMMGELRTLMIEIHPPSLRSTGLPAALDGLVATLRARGIDATTDVDPGLRLPGAIEALFFRVAQEGLRNILAHASAREALVRVWVADGRAHLTIVDDGVGFLTETDGLPTGHLGLHVMREISEDAGGVLEVESWPGAGTTVRLAVGVQP